MQSLNIAVIQSALHWQNIDANLAMFEEKIWQIQFSPDIIFLPEMFTTGFSMESADLAEPPNSKTFRWMKQQASQSKAVLIGSCIIVEKKKYFNRLFAVYPDGSFSYYDKKHLFRLAGEDASFSPGKKRLIIEVKGWRVLPLVCYDLRFPVWARSVSSAERTYEYDLVAYVANWPAPRIAAWDTLLSARAIENQSFAVGTNRLGQDGYGKEYPGHSGVYNYLGGQMAFSSEECILEATLDGEALLAFRDRFPFQRDADGFQLD
ncbi:MAG: amidohydrolase [Cyclobacteriaceae bacterium]|nr:amidohydrolase [Cyclobacteriaceae bacterium HetDA_MAG_MS6]